MIVYGAALSPGDSILAMSLDHGGHLTHGHPLSFSGKVYTIIPYGVNRETERIDHEEVASLAREHKPKLIVVGASAYSRLLDFEAFRAIADEVGAMVMADIAHIAGLIAGGVHPDPVPYCDFITTTTHKTLRGPRGGMIMCKEKYARAIDREVFPGLQGGPSMHTIAAKAVCFGEALRPEYKNYAKQVVDNARVFAETLSEAGIRIVSGGTENHLFMADVTPLGLTGRDASTALETAAIAVNKNSIPFDPNPPAIGSGIRIGTPAVTTRGLGEEEMRFIAAKTIEVLQHSGDDARLKAIGEEVAEFSARFPVQ
jgi:glycine hydroxymethyltransferase